MGLRIVKPGRGVAAALRILLLTGVPLLGAAVRPARLWAGPAPGARQVQPAAAGDVLTGKALFLGAKRLSNGAPSCRACHSVSGVGALGGGALGPDLTRAYEKFGEGGLAAILAGMPFPTMRPIFGERPLTEQEQAHLVAFLRQTAAERPAPVVVRLTGLVLGGAVILLGLVQVPWRGRLRGVRKPLLKAR
ncbi:MAG: c-type cytochrome [Gemmatimonadetes bacterium]|nr:c-type cytochrome [Gemmatimonadota bacterium]